MRLTWVHFLILVLVVVLIFGANRLPDLARSLGQSLKILKSEVKDLSDDSPSVKPGQKPDEPASGDGTTPKA